MTHKIFFLVIQSIKYFLVMSSSLTDSNAILSQSLSSVSLGDMCCIIILPITMVIMWTQLNKNTKPNEE